MAISPQQLTIYLTSAHRAVIFAIAQLSCIIYSTNYARFTKTSNQMADNLMHESEGFITLMLRPH